MDAKMNVDEFVGLGSGKVVNIMYIYIWVLMFTLRLNLFYFKIP